MKTYKAADGTMVTVPENRDLGAELGDAIQDALSPEAVTLIVAHLAGMGFGTRGAECREPMLQVQWFVDLLTETLGGVAEYNRMIDELGI